MHPLRLWVFTALALVATVSGQSDDEVNEIEQIDAALAALTVANLDDVRGNLHLPTTSNGLTVSWESNSPAVISSSGVVKRQTADTPVNLTATINHEAISRTRVLVASVRKAVSLDPFEGYAFSYFTGNSLADENIFFAASEGNNALQWAELNGGRPTITSSFGTKGLRDPFLIRSPEGDTFYLIATDLSIGSGTSWGDSVRIGSRYLEVWESHDLKTWSEQRHILVSPPEAGNTWAPEAFYDEELGAYLVFWASSLYEASDVNRTGSTYHRMLYATTRDFVTFSETSVWQDARMSRIDSTVIKSADTYYRFTKDEGASGTGCSDIIQESSASLRSTLDSWTISGSCIGRNAGTSAVEGPTVFKSNPNDVHGEKFYLFVDEYGGRGYIPLETADISKPDWKVSASYNLPSSPRHGTVIPVTAAELAALRGHAPARRALDTEVLSRTGNVGVIANVSLADSSALKVPAIIDTAAGKVLFAVQPGTDLAALAPTFTTTEGVISSPASGSTVDLRAGVKYVLEKDGKYVAEWTVSAVEMGSPILPGLYADPNVAVFNGVYYIYATSDGVPGWGGNTFYSWKSTDLVTWTRGEQPFLTLDGANGNVPWATGNAWAPTIAERDGKYYFYFSGHNAALNTKTIGVAVADAPEGPFTAEPEAMILNSEAITASQAIDPAAFRDPVSGKHYIYWGNGRPLVAELNDDMVSVNWNTTQPMDGLVDFREGLFVVYRSGLYHLTYSIDDTGSEDYRVGYATSASFAGPWAYRGVILQKDPSQGILGTGHNSMFNVPGTDDWYIVYHRFAIPGGGGYRRETAIDRVTFDPETGLINPVVPTLTSVGPQTVPRKSRRMSRVMRL
ncbi:Arabinoxylan arabinofuranohydrolase [Colletotrichum tanaceti]|uniref:Endo-1,5-alpha-L-arabinanase A n=1 Tax=Colletotrichum tanaceti TaxID=1306861 RepID=A0A4U6XIZ5_9PEZI|nr:Arabinoxylan arabinofuranohydrolase [Colletotrichum tanaceti]TKW54077.1 Arabinoxylan arabinofuranohydrolase [Colletotrichum tanaceti]